MTAYDTRPEWLVSVLRTYGSSHRVALLDVVPSGSGFLGDEVEISPVMTATEGLATSRSSERSVLTLAGGSTLRSITYGCP